MARILVINDDPDLLDLCRIVLESGGHSVEALEGGSLAVEAARRFRPDLIILDWIMPTVTGEKVLHRLKNSDAANVPVLMMSALDGAATAARLLGTEDFLAKPFGADELEAAVKKVLAGVQRHPHL